MSELYPENTHDEEKNFENILQNNHEKIVDLPNNEIKNNNDNEELINEFINKMNILEKKIDKNFELLKKITEKK